MRTKLLTRQGYEKWLRSMPKNYCSFCDWKKRQMILKEGRSWVWVANIAPYWRYHTMFVIKRHIREMSELSVAEMGELIEMYTYAVGLFRKRKLYRVDGSEIKKYVFFWRLRDDLFDPISGNMRPDHFHVHLAPDKDHLWDPTLDMTAASIDILAVLGERKAKKKLKLGVRV